MTDSVHLSQLLGRSIVDRRGEAVGRLSDVVVRLQGDAYPLVIGIAAKVARREVFVPAGGIGELSQAPLQLARQTVDVRRFERREGEVLLRADVLRHRLIDVADARLVRAWDVELVHGPEGWSVCAVDTHRPSRLFRRGSGAMAQGKEDWKALEPLIGHAASATLRGPFGRVKRLKPAQIADLLEDASKEEGTEILDVVHSDPELEADVFEEIDPDLQSRLFGARTNDQVADVLAHMRADDAADAVAELPQSRRQPVLDLLPAGQRTRVLTLLGFNPGSAGGLMGVDFVSVPATADVAAALHAVRVATAVQPEALTGIYTHDEFGQLAGFVRLTTLVQSAPDVRLAEIGESDPVHVHADSDVIDVALLMSDYNLVTIPVADDEHHVVGVITVDDVLEATIPEDWRRREPAPHPEPAPAELSTEEPATSPESPVG
ncbi:MAG TPA: CBS domain-containing protein [Mycobacteriales bacterium]|nr:CBS domain-containing protein [Mycobacteriales bacterium]